MWQVPETSWAEGDGIAAADLNRIEMNAEALRDATYRHVQGFGYSVSNVVSGQDGVITVLPGSAFSDDGFTIKSTSNIIKNLGAWAQGSGPTIGGLASGATAAAHTWYYVFVVMDPSDGSTDIMIDDSPTGAHISSGVFTKKRYVNCFKTGAAGGDGSYDFVEMYSPGDHVYINPNSMYADRGITYDNAAPTDNVYQVVTLDSGGAEGYALPARDVLADLNAQSVSLEFFGLISTEFTMPTNLITGGSPAAEYYHAEPSAVTVATADFRIRIDSSRQVALALNGTVPGSLTIAVRGFFDDRALS